MVPTSPLQKEDNLQPFGMREIFVMLSNRSTVEFSQHGDGQEIHDASQWGHI